MLVLCIEDLKPPDHQMVLGNFNGHLCIQGKNKNIVRNDHLVFQLGITKCLQD